MTVYVPNDKDRAIVRELAAYGVTHDAICKIIGVSDETMRKYYRRELDLSATEANSKVAQTLFKMATSGEHVAATIFWLKTRARWQEIMRVEGNVNVQGGIDAPTRPFDVEDVERWLERRRAQLAALDHKPH